MAQNRVVVKTHPNYEKIMRNLEKMMTGATIKVGVLQNVAKEKYEDGFTLVEVATVNEFGSQNGHIPERSFMRSTFDNEKRSFDKKLYGLLSQLLDGTMSVTRALNIAGLFSVGKIQNTILNLREPPNHPDTIARKGSSNPLIDTGRLRQSISYEITTDKDEALGL